MKKKNLKTLGLKKESISNLGNNIKGGDGTSGFMICTNWTEPFNSCGYCQTAICDTQITCDTWVTCDCPVVTG